MSNQVASDFLYLRRITQSKVANSLSTVTFRVPHGLSCKRQRSSLLFCLKNLSFRRAAGSSTIVLKSPVGWKSGDEIIVVTSDFAVHDWSTSPARSLIHRVGFSFGFIFRIKNEQTEVRTVASVSGNVVTLTTPLQFEHLGITVGTVFLYLDLLIDAGR